MNQRLSYYGTRDDDCTLGFSTVVHINVNCIE